MGNAKYKIPKEKVSFVRTPADQFMDIPSGIDAIELARRFDAFPLRLLRENGRSRLVVAMTSPGNLDRVADIEFYLGVSIIPVPATPSDITYLEQAAFLNKTWEEESEFNELPALQTPGLEDWTQ